MTRESLKSFAFMVLLSPLFLLAQENSHVSVGERFSSLEEKPVQKELEEEKKSETTVLLDYIFDSYPTTHYPASIHWLNSISAFGDSVELEDGSIWKVSAYDQYKANNWRSNDPLVITQNQRWFSKHTYRIINKNSGASIETNLHFGPIKNGLYTLYVVGIDFDHNEIRVIGGNNEITHWQISSRDWYDFEKWELNDAIIVGYNSGWDSSYESILINVNVNNFVRAKQF